MDRPFFSTLYHSSALPFKDIESNFFFTCSVVIPAHLNNPHNLEERAIDALNGDVIHRELREELGHIKPKTINHLMDITNHWADGEDAVHNNRTSLDDE